MAYDKEYYEKNKDKFSEARKKWYQKDRARKMSMGLIKPRLTEEQKKEKADSYRIKAVERYHTDPEFRKRCLNSYKSKYHSDPKFREEKMEYGREYLKKWRAAKREEKNRERELAEMERYVAILMSCQIDTESPAYRDPSLKSAIEAFENKQISEEQLVMLDFSGIFRNNISRFIEMDGIPNKLRNVLETIASNKSITTIDQIDEKTFMSTKNAGRVTWEKFNEIKNSIYGN
jgi:hypothetical protein